MCCSCGCTYCALQKKTLQHGRRPFICRRCQTGAVPEAPLNACFDFSSKHSTVILLLLRRYKGVLHAASESIAENHSESSGILALNLGPAWGNADAYKLFGDNVIEISFKDWESPPGLGICPLDVIFSVCYSISSWLNLNDDHIVVSLQPTACAKNEFPPVLPHR